MSDSRKQQALQSRQAVLDAARRLFGSRGYDATSLQQIADELGMRKANVYYYFRTKEAILDALLAPMTDRLAALLDTAERIDDPAERTRTLVEGFVDQVLASYRAAGSLGLGDPALRRDLPIARRMVELSERGARILLGDDPSPDRLAGYWLIQDLGPVLRRCDHLPDAELRGVLIRVCTRVVDLPRNSR
ncbi:TetR/AcrR family transcriptional regulator [Skermania piniformis]|uniref:TetR/AcrR family transcriptional regulator n=1 Tax=Skermania pinensis TaxID=39122 RepID=A0ABX8SDV0_9ACTN|nr:TetR/AcrR family transcriptional regulator [Skermania piniformis]QXQ13846.1 TetR/AcrR family transcriptional regulator [Skermania piniformis]